jgi:hypothetical protein
MFDVECSTFNVPFIEPKRRSPSALLGMKTPAASTTRRTQGLTSGDFFASIGLFMKNLSSRENRLFTSIRPG